MLRFSNYKIFKEAKFVKENLKKPLGIFKKINKFLTYYKFPEKTNKPNAKIEVPGLGPTKCLQILT
jgi:hypothetical protein